MSPKTWGFQSCITIFSEDILSFWLFHHGGLYHIETNILICFASQWTGFYIKGTSVMKEFKGKKECLKKVNKSDNFCFIKLRKINVNLLFVKCREKLTLTFYWCLLVSSLCSSFVVTPQWRRFKILEKWPLKQDYHQTIHIDISLGITDILAVDIIINIKI